MLKFVGKHEGRPMLGLGLSRGNCKKLLEGKPIFIDLKVMMSQMQNPPDMNDATVLIFCGEMEERMQVELSERGITIPSKKLTHDEEN